MWRFIQNVSEPPQKKKKTEEERLITQREYDKNKRERQFQPKWQAEYKWLKYDKAANNMFCDVCKRHETSGTFVNGCDNFKIQTIKRHDASESHKSYTKIEKARANPSVTSGATALKQLNKEVFNKMLLLVRNAHYIAKLGKPYTDYVTLCELDRAKGLDIGKTYLTDKYCATFVSVIADNRRLEQDNDLKQTSFLSIISDGSTDTASKEAEIVLIRSCSGGEVKTHLLGVKNVPRADSSNITMAISTLMSERWGDEWMSKVVAMGTDGASVMTGKKSGVVQRMRELTKRPFIHAIHCSAHRLELAYKDATKMCAKVHQTCEVLLLNLYLFYRNSPLNRANLMTAYKMLGIPSKVPTRVGGTRWLPHTRLALKNILHGYDAIVQHLEQIQNPCDAAHRKDSAAKGKNFLKLLNDPKVKFWLHFLLDVVTCLSQASEAIQNQKACLGDIYNELQAAKGTLLKYKKSNGPYLRKLAEQNAELDCLEHSRTSLLTHLCSAMDSRFEGDLHLFKGSTFLNFSNWPPESLTEIDDYGDSQILEIIPSCEEALAAAGKEVEEIEPEWNRFKNDMYSNSETVQKLTWSSVWEAKHRKYPNLFSFIEYLLALPSSSVDAERGFSRMKMVKNDWRSRLSDKHLSDLLLVNVETPPIDKFDPVPVVNLWNSNTPRLRRPLYMDKGKKISNKEESEKDSVEAVVVEEEEEENIVQQIYNSLSDGEEEEDSEEDIIRRKDSYMLQSKAYKLMLSLM